MNSKTKFTLMVTAMVAVTLLAVVGIMAVFAATQQTFSTSITVVYKSTDVEGTATAQWKLAKCDEWGNVNYYENEWHDMDSNGADNGGNLELDLSAAGPLSLSPSQPIDLSDENPGVVLKYTFTNSATHPYTLNFKYQSKNETKNINAFYTASSQEIEDYNLGNISNNFADILETTVLGEASENIYILLKINDLGSDSSFDGTFNIQLDGLSSDYAEDFVYLYDGTNTMISRAVDQEATTLDTTGLTYKGAPITKIGDGAFQNNTNLQTIVLNDIKEIGAYAFKDCTGITNLTIGESVTNIEDAFSGLTNLTTINYNAESATIGNTSNGLFKSAGENTDGVNLIIGDSVIDIPDYLCDIHYGSWYPKITSVEFGTNVESIGNFAFRYCQEITGTLTIPSTVKTIGDAAFSNCSGINGTLIIPDSVTAIGSDAFSGCKINEAKIGEGVLNFGSQYGNGWNPPFYNCEELVTITVDENNEKYTSQDNDGNECNVIVDKTTHTLLQGCKTSTIPDDGSVTIIGDYAFAYCTGLTNLSLPDSLIEIGADAFVQCSGISGTLTIPENVTTIGVQAFRDCTGITEIKLGTNLRTIGSYAFNGCGGTKITISENVESIGDRAFSGSFVEIIVDSAAVYKQISGSGPHSRPYGGLYIDYENGAFKILATADDGSNSYLNGLTKTTEEINGKLYNVYKNN